MFYFLMQLAAVLAAAVALGLLVGWMLWARALRHHRRGHLEQVNVLHKQLASLADENRRVQQRFASTAADLDSQRLVMQTRDTELRRAREAFSVSQQNLAGAEAQLAASQGQLNDGQQRQQATEAALEAARTELATLHAELSGLRLDSAEAKALHIRVEELSAQTSALVTRSGAAEAEAEALRTQVADANSQFSQAQSRALYLGRALDAAVERANERGESLQTEHKAVSGRVAAAHSLQLSQAVADAHDSKRADVRALTSTWEQISQKRAQQQAAHGAELAGLRSQLAAVQASLAAVRSEMASRLEAVQQHAVAQSRIEAEQRESTAVLRLTEEHSGALNSAVARHDRQLAEHVEAHQLAIAHWRNDLAQRAVAREADQATIERLQADLNAADTRFAALRTELDRVALERHLLDETAQRQTGEIQHFTSVANENQVRVEALQSQLVTAQDQRAAAQEQLQLAEAASAQLQEQITLVESESAQAREWSAVVEAELATVQERFVAVQSESGEARVRLEATRAEFAAAERETSNALALAVGHQQSAKELAAQFDTALIALGAARRNHATTQQQTATAVEESRRLADLLGHRLELAEAEAHRLHVAQMEQAALTTSHAESQRLSVEQANNSASAWKRELEALRAVHHQDLARLRDVQSVAAELRFGAPEARRMRTDTSGASTVTSASTVVPASVPVSVPASAPPSRAADDLQLIEGIGPKIAAALRSAGVTTFVRLEAASSDQLRDALASSGLTFAPSLPTWSKQAGFLVRGDATGLAVYQAELTAGREAR